MIKQTFPPDLTDPTDPKEVVEKNFYDGNDNIKKHIDKKGYTFEYSYTFKNLPWLKKAFKGTELIDQVEMKFDDAGKLTTIIDGIGSNTKTTSYEYYKTNDPEKEKSVGQVSKLTLPDGSFYEYFYNAAGMRNRFEVTIGSSARWTINYSQDAQNRINSVRMPSHNITESYTYQNNSLLNTMERSEYSEKTFTYDGILLDEQTEKKKSDQSLIGKYQLDYDNTDNITSIVDNEKTHTFSYDDLNRIKTSSIQNEAYSYDLGGNRNTLQTDKPFNHNTVEYQHDIWDRLSKVVNATGETVEYQYNGEGLMDERTKNGVTTRYYYDGKDIIAEAVVKPDQTVELKTRYLRGANGLIARISENAEEKTRYGGVAYYHHNQHGDVTSLRDKSGNVLNSYAYDIWGNILTEGTSETIDNPFTYSGEYWDKTTSLQYLRARWYDPSMGRFISEDSYEGEINSPLSLNRYTYGHNNPLTYIDPSGHRVEKGGGVESTNRYVTVNVTTFIPDSKIPETAYLGHGDGRDLWEDGTFRTKHTIVIDTVTGTVVYESKESSPSHISAFGFGHSEPAPSTDSLDYSVKINGKGEIVVNMKGDIASEALPENVNISYDFSITISSDGKKGPKLKGSHDGFPAYEVSVYDSSTNKKYGYGFNPRDNFEFIGSLMGKKEWKVNKSMPLLKK